VGRVRPKHPGTHLPAQALAHPWKHAPSGHVARNPDHGDDGQAHGRCGPGRREPESIRHLAVVLLGPDAGFVTGQEFIVDGGMTRKMQYA